MSDNDARLSATLKAALLIWDRTKADGATLGERVQAFAKTLRLVWPFQREWKYLCHSCDDYGLVIHACAGDASCGRTKPHLAHSYGQPCWCEAGRRFKAKADPTPEDALAQVGKSKSRPMTRWGR